MKWKIFESTRHGVTPFAGEHVITPLTQRTYTLGSYTYLAVAKSFATGARISAGAYDVTAHVSDPANRGGVQASFQQTLTKRASFATDWYSGNTTAGYLTSGFSYKPTPTPNLLTGVQMGNHDLLSGNHFLLVVLGRSPAWNRKAR